MSWEQKDTKELESFGYKQQLKRSMGSFSSFAISFSLISIITGIYANFAYGIQQAGSLLLWSWALVGFGQFLVALVMADLAARYPISGYGYQWSSRLSNAHVGFFIGWLLLLQFITGFPGVCQALADTLEGILQIKSDSWSFSWITIAIISLTALVHLFGIKLVTWVNNLGVYAELLGSVFIILFLWGSFLLGTEMDFGKLGKGAINAQGEGVSFAAFALSLLVGAWCLTGFEAAADLAEETREPRKTVPRAVILSQLSAAVGGFLMIGGFILMADSMQELQNSDQPLIMILERHLGETINGLIGMIIILSIFACGVASMATASRLIFSLARDNMLPFSDQLKKVHPEYRTPRAASLLVWALACISIMLLPRLELISSISAVAGYLGYSGIMLVCILSVKSSEEGPYFSLGKWRKFIQVAALIWTLLLVIALTLPPTEIEGMDENYLPAKSTSLAIGVGILLYFLLIRKKIIRGEAGVK